jgi:hypothetical protein
VPGRAVKVLQTREGRRCRRDLLPSTEFNSCFRVLKWKRCDELVVRKGWAERPRPRVAEQDGSGGCIVWIAHVPQCRPQRAGSTTREG